MSRNYSKENEWRKTKYVRILADIDKELGNELKDKLKQDGKTVSAWVTENAKKYLKKL